MKLLKFLPQGLNASLLVNVFGWGIVFTLFITFGQMAYQYQDRRGEVESKITTALEEALPGIATSVYTADDEQLKLQLKQLFNTSGIVFLQVTEIKGLDYYYNNLGVVDTPYDFLVERTLTYQVGTVTRFDFGKVVVFGSYDPLYQQILVNALHTLVSNLILTLLICLVLFTTINSLVVQHLRALIDSSSDLNIDKLSSTIRLKRNSNIWNKDDELEQLTRTLNQTRKALQEELFKYDKARNRAKELSLTDNKDLQNLFQRENTERLLSTALTNAKLYRCGFSCFWISIENYENISVEVGDEIRDKGLHIFNKRLYNKITSAIKHLDIDDFDLSSFAKVSDTDFIAVVLGINSHVNAASFCKRIHDVGALGIEIGARRIEVDIRQACVVCTIPENVTVEAITQRIKHNLIAAKVNGNQSQDFKIEIIGTETENASE